MHAPVTRFKSEPGRIDEGVRNIKENVIPNVKKLPGFKVRANGAGKTRGRHQYPSVRRACSNAWSSARGTGRYAAGHNVPERAEVSPT